MFPRSFIICILALTIIITNATVAFAQNAINDSEQKGKTIDPKMQAFIDFQKGEARYYFFGITATATDVVKNFKSQLNITVVDMGCLRDGSCEAYNKAINELVKTRYGGNKIQDLLAQYAKAN